MKKSIRQSIQRLLTGNSNFVNNNLTSPHQDSYRRKSLVSGQNPFAVILTCSDSRLVPELIFDTGLGELFVIRVAGNVANQSTTASIEYAVAHLSVNVIVVLGHQNCGAVTSAVNGENTSRHIEHLLTFIEPANTLANSKVIDDVATLNAKLTAKKLFTDSKIIADSVNTGKVKLIPAFYSLETGRVTFIE